MLFFGMAKTAASEEIPAGIVSSVMAPSMAGKMEEVIIVKSIYMKIKNGFELRDVCGENIIIAHGVENIDFTKVITLNESASFIWKQVEGKEFTEEDMVKILLDEYEVEESQAQADVKSLAESWLKAGLVE